MREIGYLSNFKAQWHERQTRPQRVGLFLVREDLGDCLCLFWSQWDGRFWRDPDDGRLTDEQDIEWQDLSEES